MNYLVAVDTFFPDRPTGSARVAWDIARIVRDKGHNVTIFCRKQNEAGAEVEEFDGVEVVRFELPELGNLDPFKMRKTRLAGIKAAQKHLAGRKWDLTHIHLPLNGHMVYDVLGSESRYVYTVHSPVVLEQKAHWSAQGMSGKIKLALGLGQLKKLEGGLLKKVEKIHTLSRFTKETIDQSYGVGGKAEVIPHWCREDFSREKSPEQAREQLNWPQEKKIFFTVRRLVPRMGLDVAIEAIAPFLQEDENLRFAIAGCGELENELKSLAFRLNVRENIWFMGRISDEELRSCYEAADMFVLPTRALECFGLIILEAFAFGLPVISTDAGAIPELMNRILPDCVVPAGDVEALNLKIRQYLNNELELPSSEELIRHVNTNFNKELITSKLCDLLELEQS